MARAEILITTLSCARDRANGRQQASESTWVKAWGRLVDRRVMLGRSNKNLSPTEVALDIGDTYAECPHKLLLAVKWAHAQGYEHMFCTSVDTYICVPRLIYSGYKRAPYIGYRCDEGHASGGAGYWLNGEAIRIIASETNTGGIYEDLWVGHVLAREGITIVDDRRYYGSTPEGWPEDMISCHLGRGTDTFQPEWMHDCHRAVVEQLRAE